jgi:hypothetical protein
MLKEFLNFRVNILDVHVIQKELILTVVLAAIRIKLLLLVYYYYTGEIEEPYIAHTGKMRNAFTNMDTANFSYIAIPK